VEGREELLAEDAAHVPQPRHEHPFLAPARLAVLGRLGDGDDVGKVIAFLVSDAGAWVTGQILEASGGFRL
jgi:NAD(P)-dependent dehydrogenase (short-subunit alcohol dehydrogenase family)